MTAQPIDLHWVQRPGTRIRGLHRPTTVRQALELLRSDPGLRPVAGGTDLVLELARSERGGVTDLLDVTHIEGFRDLRISGADATTPISIGAGVTHADVLASPAAVEQLFPLAQACLEIGSPQLRNRATVVGNLVTASPANDTISALLALDASVVIASLGPEHAGTGTGSAAGASAASPGPVIERTVPLGEFHPDFRRTVLAPGELVVRVEVPAPSATQRAVWVKAGLRKAQAISVVHVGIVLDVDAHGVVSTARVALGSVAPTVVLSEAAAAELVGSTLTDESIAAAADAAANSVEPIDDVRATAEYRSDSIRVMVSRALRVLAAGTERDRWPERVPLLAQRRRTDAAPRTPVRDVTVNVNGNAYTAPVTGSGTLLDWLRDAVGPGTKEGCAEGECGACTVHLDGDAVMSCLVPAGQADGSHVRTIEGLGTEADVHPMKQAFVDRFAVQCGYCIPGFVMAAERLSAELDHKPTRAEVELALSGNLCRCTGYYNIIDAVLTAIEGDR